MLLLEGWTTGTPSSSVIQKFSSSTGLLKCEFQVEKTKQTEGIIAPFVMICLGPTR